MLANSQAALSTRFAGKTPDRYRFDDVPRFLGPHGATFFKGGAAYVEVETETSTAGGDHTIFVGLVTWLQSDPNLSPLVYHQGAHHELTLLAEPETSPRARLAG
jgi:flavin reductase (DIM6/NTAB) family NADH-FMN oxidoreductase RutF